MLRYIIFILIFLLTTLSLWAENKTIWLSENLVLEEISEKTYIHRSKIQLPPWGDVWANGLLIIDQKTLLIDTPWTNEQTSLIYHWLKKNKGKSPDYLVITHSHQDNQGGLAFCLEQKTQCYSLEQTRDIALKKELPVAGHYFKSSYEFDLGGITAQAVFHGSGHTLDNIVIWLKAKKLLFGGCLVREMKAMGLGNTAEADLKAWPKTITALLETYSGDILVVPGHGQQGGRELLEHTLMLTTPQIHSD